MSRSDDARESCPEVGLLNAVERNGEMGKVARELADQRSGAEGGPATCGNRGCETTGGDRVKRVLDFLLASLLLIFLAPAILLLMLLVRVNLGTPVFFTQLRPGRYSQPFRMIKFRTMTDARDANGELRPDSERLTRFGSFLRATSLDELPELLNVWRGEMSFVGPRPLLMEYLDRYTPEQARRDRVKPGITGWAQVNGRNAISWEEKFRLDAWYVDNRNVRLDLYILFLTLWKVVRRDGISAADHATMPEFMGSFGAKHESGN